MRQLFFYFVILLIGFVNSVKINFKCRGNGETLPHKNDCRKYYKCKISNNGKLRRKLMHCKDGTLYDSTWGFCDKAHKVNCQSFNTRFKKPQDHEWPEQIREWPPKRSQNQRWDVKY